MKFQHIIHSIACFAVFMLTSCYKTELNTNAQQLESAWVNDIVLAPNGDLYAVCGNKGKNGSLFKSNDLGQSWKRQFSAQGTGFNCLRFLNDSIYYLGGDQFWLGLSQDHGNSFNKYHFDNLPLADNLNNINDIAFFDVDGMILISGQDNAQGQISIKLPTSLEWKHTVTDQQVQYVASNAVGWNIGGFGVIYSFQKPEFNPTFTSFEKDFATSGFFKDNLSWSCGFNGGIYCSGNNWQSYEVKVKPNKVPFDQREHFNKINFNGQAIAAVGENGVIYISKNQGQSWDKMRISNAGDFKSVLLLSDSKMLIGSDNGNVYTVDF